MSALQNYSTLIDGIFGIGTTKFKVTKHTTNNIIGALNNKNDFFEFKNNFISRLERLNKIYTLNNNSRKDLIVQVNAIADSKNWEGAYAELATFDYLNQDYAKNKFILNEPIEPNVTIANTDTYGAELGKKEANLDGYIKEINLYFDIKCFKDNIKEIFKGIFKELEIYLNITNLAITAEYEIDVSYEIYRDNRKDLLEELKKNISKKDQTRNIESTIIQGLSYKILWNAGVQSVERTYDPYIHAKELHSTIFNYANKFTKHSPCFIVLVIFPWYNNIVTDFSNTNINFYRAFARRVFCQYIHNNDLFNTFEPSFTGSESIHEISQKISGIIFLEDKCISSNDQNAYNINSYTYLNPNATHKALPTRIHSFIVNCMENLQYDDFENDNY